MLLPEDDVLLGTIERPPGSNTTFQRAPDTGADLRVAATDLVENGDRAQARDTLKQGHHLAVPNHGQWVSSSSTARHFLLRRQPRVLFDAIGGGSAKSGLGRGDDRRLGLTETHEQPHLAIGDVAAGQGAVPHQLKNPSPIRPAATASKPAPLGRRHSPDSQRQSGYALLPS